MSAAVAAVSLLLAALGVGKMLSSSIDGWSEGKDLLFGLIVVAVIALSYLAARLSAGRLLAQRTPA